MHVLYHDRAQITENCFVAQLYEVLGQHFDLVPTSLDQLRVRDYELPTGPALSLLKQRTWRRNIPFIAKYAETADLYFYDQDPWEAYRDKASSPEVYGDLASMVPVKRFLVTSGFWADHIRKDGLPASFVRMGVLPRNCDPGPAFEDRPIELGFQGTLHPHRQAFFERLGGMGLTVETRPGTTYEGFLKSVQDIGIFIHNEAGDVLLGGKQSQNGLWIKDIEVAARGCFTLRNSDLDIGAYGIDELPTVYVYRHEKEIPELIERIRSLPNKNEIVRHTVERIKERNDWLTVVNALK